MDALGNGFCMNDQVVMMCALRPELLKQIGYPSQMTSMAAGFDLRAAIEMTVRILPGQRRLFPCGFAIALPPGWEAQVRPRSGLALKHGITVLNSPGTIDADYRGEIQVLLINLGEQPFEVTPGMRIAQMVMSKVATPKMHWVDSLDSTERGSAGYGSTGTI
mgnify:CR=1 FL=1